MLPLRNADFIRDVPMSSQAPQFAIPSSPMQRGQAAVQARNFEEAVRCFAEAVAQDGRNPQAVAALGQSLCWLGRREEGVAQLRQSGQLLAKKARKTRDVSLTLNLADQLQYWTDYAGARDLARTAVQINPAEVRGYQLLAVSCLRLNLRTQALAAGRQAARLAPDSATLQILLATLEAAEKLHEPARSRLEKVLQGRLSPEEAFRAHKELANILDKLGEYDQVFAHLHAAAELSAQLPEVRRQDTGLVPRMIESHRNGFDPELLRRWSAADLAGDVEAPSFVLGFMRSGTTLTQEVLAAHPRVLVADESSLLSSLGDELRRMNPCSGSLADQLRALDREGIRHLRAHYWKLARGLFGEKLSDRHLVDKTTMNTIDLGLLNCVFPDAKLVFVMRDPRDVCLSCFMQTMIPTPSTVHLYTWQGTADFYALMLDWWLLMRERLSVPYLELRYEDAVTDFESSFRRVFEFLQLPWDPAVAEFHMQAARKYVNSPSFSQVAQPLYSSSVGRWRRYAHAFEAIGARLRPYVDAFGYEA